MYAGIQCELSRPPARLGHAPSRHRISNVLFHAGKVVLTYFNMENVRKWYFGVKKSEIPCWIKVFTSLENLFLDRREHTMKEMKTRLTSRQGSKESKKLLNFDEWGALEICFWNIKLSQIKPVALSLQWVSFTWSGDDKPVTKKKTKQKNCKS